jgi:hypothetical protein
MICFENIKNVGGTSVYALIVEGKISQPFFRDIGLHVSNSVSKKKIGSELF